LRPQTQRAGQPVVLHLTSAASRHSEQFNRAIVDAGALCVQAGNVYEALARTVQPGGQDCIDVVFGCLDCLTDAELEFFELVHQCRPELRVYVYASGPDASRAEPLLDRHLASLLMPSEVPSILGSLTADSLGETWGRAEPSARAASATPTPDEHAPEPRETAAEATPAGARDERQSHTGVEQQASKPPVRRPPAAPDSHPADDRPDVLLTQEELAALLGRNGDADSQEPQP